MTARTLHVYLNVTNSGISNGFSWAGFRDPSTLCYNIVTRNYICTTFVLRSVGAYVRFGFLIGAKMTSTDYAKH